MPINMSYRRAQNTLEALRELYASEPDPRKLSEEEQRAFKKLVKICRQIADDYEEESK